MTQPRFLDDDELFKELFKGAYEEGKRALEEEAQFL